MEILHPKNEQELMDLIEKYPMVVVDLYSTDCPPCNRLAPIYERAAEQFESVTFIKIHRQEFRDLAEKYYIFSSPTVLFFFKGVLQEKRLAGDIQENDLYTEIEQLLQKKSTDITG